MKYTIFLSLLFIWQNIAISTGANDMLEGKYNMAILKRPNSDFPPLDNYNVELSAHGTNYLLYTVKVSRHHIIPLSCLTRFYNKLIKKSEIHKLTAFWNKFDEKVEDFFFKKAKKLPKNITYNTTIENVRKIVNGLLNNKIVFDPNARRPENFDEFQGYYAWLPGNLFIGPNNRSDDPGDRFEKNAKVIVELGTFNNLKTVYDLMQAYVDGKKVDFNKLSNGLRDIANFSEPQELNSSHWVYDKQDGTYKIHVGGNENPISEVLEIS